MDQPYILEAGVLVHSARGINVRLAGTYDGIGVSSFESLGGQFWINIPLC